MNVRIRIDGLSGILGILLGSAPAQQLTSIPTIWKASGWKYLSKEGVTIPVPSVKELHLLACRLCPWITICERRIKSKRNDAKSQKNDCSQTANQRIFTKANAGDTSCNVIIGLTKSDNGKVESREIMMQEQLALHQVEGKVVECPTKYRGTYFVVESFEYRIVVILESSLPPQNSKTLENGEDGDGQS